MSLQTNWSAIFSAQPLNDQSLRTLEQLHDDLQESNELYALVQQSSHPDDHKKWLKELQQQLKNLKRNLNKLAYGDRQLGLPAPSDHIKKIIFQEPVFLQKRLYQYIQSLYNTEGKQTPSLAQLHQTSKALDHDLEQLHKLYQQQMQKHWQQLQRTIRQQTASLSGFVLLIILLLILAVILRKRAQHQLELLDNIVYHSMEGMVIARADAGIIMSNPAYCHYTGFSSSELIDQPIPELDDQQYPELAPFIHEKLQEHHQWRGEIAKQCKDKSIIPMNLSLVAIHNELGVIYRYIAIYADIQEQKEKQQQLHKQSRYDPLTKLANRMMFEEQLAYHLALASRHQYPLALLMIDLDGFKAVNDKLGHDQGDLVLQTVAQRLLKLVRSSDVVARLGGDEFIIILSRIQYEKDPVIVAEKIIESLNQPLELKETACIGASIGISLYPNDAKNRDELIKHSDIAMYKAKKAGKNTYRIFNNETEASP